MNAKTKLLAFGFLGISIAMHVPPVAATTYVEVKMVCPIGKEKFTAQEVMSNSSFGQRPDGKPFSPLPVVPFAECPSNGFPLFREEFSKEDLAVLEPVVASAAYQASRSSETQRYRVWMLQKALGEKPGGLASSLMVAGWETDEDAQRKARYQEQFVSAVDAIDRASDEEAWLWLNLRAGNALRELGKFSGAVARFDLVAANLDLLADVQLRADVGSFIALLKQLAVEENTASQPAGAVPDDVGAFRCVIDRSSLSASERTVCESEAMAATIMDFEIETDQGTLKGAEAIREMHRSTSQDSGSR